MRKKDQTKARRIEAFINDFFLNNYRSPSIREIEAGIGISRQTVYRYLLDLCDSGRVRNLNGSFITELIESSLPHFNSNLPLAGSVSCGPPLMEEAWSGTNITGFLSFLDKTAPYYILRANGDSMKNAGIDEGDYIIIKKANTASYGEIVVAENEYSENTLKRLLFDPQLQRPILHPENPAYSDIIPQEIKIQGIAIHVIKRIE